MAETEDLVHSLRKTGPLLSQLAPLLKLPQEILETAPAAITMPSIKDMPLSEDAELPEGAAPRS